MMRKCTNVIRLSRNAGISHACANGQYQALSFPPLKSLGTRLVTGIHNGGVHLYTLTNYYALLDLLEKY